MDFAILFLLQLLLHDTSMKGKDVILFKKILEVYITNDIVSFGICGDPKPMPGPYISGTGGTMAVRHTSSVWSGKKKQS